MAAIAATAVSLYPTATMTIAPKAPSSISHGPSKSKIVTKKLKITGVTAGDTATPDVLGFVTLIAASNGFYSTASLVPVAINPSANSDKGGLVIGTGPSNTTVYLTVTGTI